MTDWYVTAVSQSDRAIVGWEVEAETPLGALGAAYRYAQEQSIVASEHLDVTATDVRSAIETLRAAGYLVIDPDGGVKARWEEPTEPYPMPAAVAISASLRQDSPVARVVMHDVLGDARVVDLSPEVALDLLVKLGQFVRQTGAEGL